MRDFEVILSNNVSTDATPEICSRYAAQDSRFRHLRLETTIWPIENFLFARDQATAPYFLWRAHDDLSAETYLVTCPPGRPSFITRVFGVDSGRFRVWQARRARCHQVAQAPGSASAGVMLPSVECNLTLFWS